MKQEIIFKVPKTDKEKQTFGEPLSWDDPRLIPFEQELLARGLIKVAHGFRPMDREFIVNQNCTKSRDEDQDNYLFRIKWNDGKREGGWIGWPTLLVITIIVTILIALGMWKDYLDEKALDEKAKAPFGTYMQNTDVIGDREIIRIAEPAKMSEENKKRLRDSIEEFGRAMSSMALFCPYPTTTEKVIYQEGDVKVILREKQGTKDQITIEIQRKDPP